MVMAEKGRQGGIRTCESLCWNYCVSHSDLYMGLADEWTNYSKVGEVKHKDFPLSEKSCLCHECLKKGVSVTNLMSRGLHNITQKGVVGVTYLLNQTSSNIILPNLNSTISLFQVN